MAKANAYIDSTLGFFCPRIVNTLMLPGNSVGVEKKNVSVNVYPNPTTDYVSFNSSSNIQSITIFDNNGKLINSFNPNRFTFTISVSDLAKGIYHAEISNGNVIRNEKFIVE